MEERAEQSKGMRPIWYFVGGLLIIVGLIVEAASFWQIFHPFKAVALWKLYVAVWWGTVICRGGLILFLVNRHKRI